MENRSERLQVCPHKVLPKLVVTNSFSFASTDTYVVSVSIGSDFFFLFSPCIFCESSYVTEGKEDADPRKWTGNLRMLLSGVMSLELFSHLNVSPFFSIRLWSRESVA